MAVSAMIHGQDARATFIHGQDARATFIHGQDARATSIHGQDARATDYRLPATGYFFRCRFPSDPPAVIQSNFLRIRRAPYWRA